MTYYISDNGVDREATDEEVAAIRQREQETTTQLAAQAAAAEQAAAAAASGRAKLAALGLTDDEINALLGA